MYRFTTITAITILVCVSYGQAQKADSAAPSSPVKEGPTFEMNKLFRVFLGRWRVAEAFEISSELQGKTRQGTARFRKGPGPSLIEEYQSDGSAGHLNALSFLWWDDFDHVYRYLTCANNDGCQLRGTVKWDGTELVNSWEDTVDGKTALFRDIFEDISPSSFRVISEGTVGGKTIWRVVTKHERLHESGR